MVGLKRTYRKVILREVRFSLSRFLAIFAIVALGVGFLAGLLAAAFSEPDPEGRDTWELL